MESVPLDASSDDREEGEIVDDDFEDISDNSIIVPIFSGKSVSPKEHLPAISLSSVTEVDEPKSEIKTRRRHKISRKKCTKTKKRRNSYRKSTCSDSDSDDYLELDRKLQEQLKAAIRVDDTDERHKNSLRSRLKGMTKLDESDSCVEKNDKEGNIQDKNSLDEGDSELAELRLEALRTAVLNKFMHRKKRKVKESKDNDVLSDTSIKTDNSETNKENNQNIVENCPKRICLHEPVQNGEKKTEIANNIVVDSITPPEEDEDVLRALLLASMSKKITSETGRKKTVLPITNNGVKKTLIVEKKKKETTNIIVNNVTNFKSHTTKNMVNKNLNFPEVKPLIINVNEDSDSEDDLFNKTIKNSNDKAVVTKRTEVEIENSVEKFLKEQRAKVEAQLSPIPTLPAKPKNVTLRLDKSSVKLLPKVKQMEYQKLLQKLKNAERKRRIRRTSQKLNGEGKPTVYTSKIMVRTKTPVTKQLTPVPKVDPVLDVKSEIRTLQRIFKEIQVQKNGRLQIQEKYKALMPVIKRINEVSAERRKWEDEVKRLLQEITDMKKKLVKSQEDFSAQINSLVQEKERIDKSINLKNCELVAEPKARFTSTPIKENPPVNSFETSSIPITTPNNSLPLSEKVAEPAVESPKEEDVLEAPLNPGDPNDIDIIYSKQKNTFPKYISPLDSVKRVVVDDPFSIVCPYDVDGNCRDPECIYKHLLK